jgi:regulator of cell morphogenesis and NO signaling
MNNNEHGVWTLSSTEPSVQDWVTVSTARARVFERYGIGYCCCGGRKTLSQACRDAGLETDHVLADLHCVDEEMQSKLNGTFTRSMCMRHAKLRDELPRLSVLVAKVAGKHSAAFPQADDIQATYEKVRRHFEDYVTAEEHEFAARGSAGQAQADAAQALQNQRLILDGALRELRRASHDFTLPDGACITYRVAIESLAELESDWHEHLRQERLTLISYKSEESNHE